jgi:Leucine-rich repeat (LRR) protein
MEIPCEFIYDHNTYKCIVKDIDLRTTASKSILTFKGEHFHGLSNNEVNMVVFRNSLMSTFPRGLTKIFPRLTLMEVHECGLKEIAKNDLRGYENLVFLSVIFNRLRSLPGDLFECTPNLQFIDLSGNQIRSVGSSLFDPLKRIAEFTMKQNAAVDIEYVEDFHPRQSAKKLKRFIRLIKERCRAMESLRDIATMQLCEGIDESNAVDVFICSSRFEMAALREKAFEVIKKKIAPWMGEELVNQPEVVMRIVEGVRK